MTTPTFRNLARQGLFNLYAKGPDLEKIAAMTPFELRTIIQQIRKCADSIEATLDAADKSEADEKGACHFDP